MPSTRSSRNTSLHETSGTRSSKSENNDITEVPTPASNTFKTSLQRFQYEAPTPPQTTRQTRSTTTTQTNKATQTSASTSASSPPNPKPKPPHSPSPSSSPSSSTSPNPPTKKRKRKQSKYAPPSTYAHLPPLQDILTKNLIAIFIGTNPGIRTATSGHAYAHPSNSFWKILYSSGCTPRLCRPSEDVDLPRLFGLGNTNIVSRPTRDAAELGKTEMRDGAVVLEEKVRRFRPEAVCVVGKGIWEAVFWMKMGRALRRGEFGYGWQGEEFNMGRVEGKGEEEGWKGARVFVASSTSGLSASLRPAEKEAIWKPFGEWVKKRREERAEEEEKKVKGEGQSGDDDGGKALAAVNGSSVHEGSHAIKTEEVVKNED